MTNSNSLPFLKETKEPSFIPNSFNLLFVYFTIPILGFIELNLELLISFIG